MKLIPIVLSGGSGSRLWPISRSLHPKQFSPLLEETLQTLTLRRLQKYDPPVIVTGEKLKSLTEKEIAEHHFKVNKIIYESEGKNTAPAVALACRYLELKGLQNQICGVFSSDALITKEDKFHAAINAAHEAAQLGKIVVLGIQPDRIETGFGYIQVSNEFVLGNATGLDANAPNAAGLAVGNLATKVLKFHEKPNYETAEKFIQMGNFFWNAGIFIFSVDKMIHYFKIHQPEMWTAIERLTEDLKNIDTVYASIKNISLDNAIIENLAPVELSCVPCDIGWSDLGSWDVVDQINNENTLKMAKSSIQIKSSGNSVFSKEKKIYSFVGVSDLIVVDTEDAILICKKGESQSVKDVVDRIKLNMDVTWTLNEK